MNEYSAPAKFIDLATQQERIRPQLDNAISRVLDHGNYIMGPEVFEFESKLKDFTGCKHAITCANGTDALTICLMAWNVGPGDAVFVPSFTYVASAESPAQLGATPFFVDVKKDTFNIDPDSLLNAIKDAKKIGLKPMVVVAVDLFGQPTEIDEIQSIAKIEKIKVLVDGAQSFGALSKNRRTGIMGDATTTSFFPAKPLGCYGDGGAIFTNNDELASVINSIRLHGKGSEKYDNIRIGLNSRLDTIQAAILLEKINLFPEELALRDKAAKKYDEILKDIFEIPFLIEGVKSAWAQYTLKTENRQELQKKLLDAGIPTGIYYPKPLHEQIGYSHFPNVSTGLQISSQLSKTCVSLPMHPYLKDEYFDLLEKIIKE
jgi:dTDP-4-amino-4,6-dideoxygalactose transaminase